jgi:hypothetical protein
MRRFALLGFASLVSACSFAGSPFDGFGGFIGDTHSVYRDPNRPVGNSETMLRVTGREVTVPPLEPEAGNIWPGPQPPEPTLEDIERQQNTTAPTPGGPGPAPSLSGPAQVPPGPVLRGQPRVVPQGSSAPPSQVPAVVSAPAPAAAPPKAPAPRYPNGPPSPTINTPQGPSATTSGGNGITTYTVPGGGTGIVVPNGNGTNTLVGPDGSVQTVPAPR